MKMRFLTFVLVVGCFVSLDYGAVPDTRQAEAVLDHFIATARTTARNAAEAEDALKNIKSIDRAVITKVVLSRIAVEKDHKKIARCILVLQKLEPPPKKELLAELNRESDASRKVI